MNLVVFFALAFALSWAWWLPLVLAGVVVVPGLAPSHIPGLVGPAIAGFVAAALIEGRPGVADLWRRVIRVRVSPRGWLAAFAPLAFLSVAIVVQRLVEGEWPDWSGLGRFSGIPEFGVLPVLVIVFVANALGEEIGWRGYALPRLQARLGPRMGTMALFPLWALWHLPLFWVVGNFLGMDLFTLFGWVVGIFAGTLVLANVAHLASGSVLAVAIWHFTYNLAATELGSTVPMVTTFFVIVWAVALVRREWRGLGPSLLSVPPVQRLAAPADKNIGSFGSHDPHQ